MAEPEGGGFTVTTLACGHRDLGITRPFQCIHEYEKWRQDMSEARSDTRETTLVDACPGRVKGGHQQASDDMLQTLGANEDSNLCVWCLQYDVCSDD